MNKKILLMITDDSMFKEVYGLVPQFLEVEVKHANCGTARAILEACAPYGKVCVIIDGFTTDVDKRTRIAKCYASLTESTNFLDERKTKILLLTNEPSLFPEVKDEHLYANIHAGNFAEVLSS